MIFLMNKKYFFLLLSIFSVIIVEVKAAADLKNSVQENPANTPSEPKNLKLYIEAGANISQGNTRQEDFYVKNNLDYKFAQSWTEILRTRLENKKTNNLRVKERYDVNNQLRFNFSEKNYRFGELEYIDDRYGGYDYRVSETVGLGRNLISKKDINNNDIMTLSIQIGAGLRQSKLTTDEKENSPLARASGDFSWKIKDGLNFQERLDFSVDESVAITKSDASLKLAVSKSLYLQLGLFIENRSNTASSNIKKTDSTVMTMIGYSY